MMAAFLALHLAAAPSVTLVTYEDVPPEVVRVTVLEWRDESPPEAVPAAMDRQGSRVTVRGASGRRSLMLLERSDGAYLVDGPFEWPAQNARRVPDSRWRRTIIVSSAEPIAAASAVEWVSAHPERGGEWPRCMRTDDRRWGCWGAALGETGVIVCRAPDRLWWSIVASAGAPTLRSSKWGRLLIVPASSGEPGAPRVRLAHPVPPPPQRLQSVRLETATVVGAQSTPVAAGAAWLSGEEVPPKAWVDVRTRSAGPIYLALQEVAEGSPVLPLTLRLEETRAIDGLAVGSGEQPASGALVTLFRLIDPPRASRDAAREKPRRVFVAETTADASGAFHIDGAGEADYELVAWHPQLGRASAPLPGNTAGFVVHLESPGSVRGRVLSAGKPLGGVDIISFPAPEAFQNADDLMDVKGGDTRTGGDGRFDVMVASGGGGELRVGGGTFAVKRIPLPRVPARLLDLGDIELGAPLEITIVLDQDTACEIRGTGPVGQSGLQIVTGTRTAPGLYRMVVPEPGLWVFGLLCGRDEHALSPSMVQISAAQAGKEVHFSIR
jgi:hypothetical protein